MITMRMVQPAVYEIVDMVTMRHRFVSAIWTVCVRAMDFRRALRGICRVDRDDMYDYGAHAFVGVIRQIRRQSPMTKIEVLTPDFRGQEMPLAKVIGERPDVFNHNVEVVPRLYPLARRGSRFERSCRVLQTAKEMGGEEVVTKSGLMVGLAGIGYAWLRLAAPDRVPSPQRHLA